MGLDDGDCCPRADGAFLSCCDPHTAPGSGASPTATTDGDECAAELETVERDILDREEALEEREASRGTTLLATVVVLALFAAVACLIGVLGCCCGLRTARRHRCAQTDVVALLGNAAAGDDDDMTMRGTQRRSDDGDGDGDGGEDQGEGEGTPTASQFTRHVAAAERTTSGDASLPSWKTGTGWFYEEDADGDARRETMASIAESSELDAASGPRSSSSSKHRHSSRRRKGSSHRHRSSHRHKSRHKHKSHRTKSGRRGGSSRRRTQGKIKAPKRDARKQWRSAISAVSSKGAIDLDGDGRYDGAAEEHQWTMATHDLGEKKKMMKERRERAHRKRAKQKAVKAENAAADAAVANSIASCRWKSAGNAASHRVRKMKHKKTKNMKKKKTMARMSVVKANAKDGVDADGAPVEHGDDDDDADDDAAGAASTHKWHLTAQTAQTADATRQSHRTSRKGKSKRGKGRRRRKTTVKNASSLFSVGESTTSLDSGAPAATGAGADASARSSARRRSSRRGSVVRLQKLMEIRRKASEASNLTAVSET